MALRLNALHVVALLGLAAPATGVSQTAVRRDSAGVSLVTYARNAVPRRFTLQQQGVELGTTPGTELIRVVSALKMPNGRILVADGRRNHILSFASNGTFERLLARDGAGPGEFNNLRSMHRRGRDSIVAHDGRQARFSVFSDTTFARQVLLQKSEHVFLAEMSVLGLLPDGRPIVTSGAALGLGPVRGPARVERQMFPLVVHGSDGGAGQLLGRYPGFEIEVSALKTGPLAGAFSPRPRLFGPTTMFALLGDHVVIVDNASYGFDVIAANGRLIRRVRREVTPDPVRPSHMAAYAGDRVSGVSDPARKASLRSEYESESHAEIFPALEARVVVDAIQRIWLGSYKRPGDKEQDWWLFGLDGAVLGLVSVPSSFTVTDAGPDYVLDVWRDPDGVETVRQYRLTATR